MSSFLSSKTKFNYWYFYNFMRNNRTILHNLLALEIFNFSHFKMSYRINGWWSDAGTQESYRKANEVIENNLDSKLVKILEMMN